MGGFTLIELLMGINVLTPIEAGVMEGKDAGIIGGVIGVLVGFIIAVLWSLVFYSWMRRNVTRIQASRVLSGAFMLSIFLMMFALPLMAGVITHQLTAPFYR